MTKCVASVLFAGALRLRRKSPARVILYYHGISEDEVDSFARQMAFLSAHYQVVPTSCIRTARGQSLPLVALTFDDALVSVLDHVVPILLRHGLTATLCAPTGRLGQPPGWDMADDCPQRDDCVMTAEQIRHLGELGFEWFSHELSHAPLSKLSKTELRYELTESKARLEQILGREVIGISYPHGACDQNVARMAREAGYHMGVTIEPAFADEGKDDLLVGRTAVSGADALFTFRLKACGAYKATCYLVRAKRLVRRCLALCRRSRNPARQDSHETLLEDR